MKAESYRKFGIGFGVATALSGIAFGHDTVHVIQALNHAQDATTVEAAGTFAESAKEALAYAGQALGVTALLGVASKVSFSAHRDIAPPQEPVAS